jgi:hypothetical protein
MSAILAKSAVLSPKLTVAPSAPPRIAVAIPTRRPPNAVAKNTAGIYGVKNMSVRIRARHQRAAVDKATQETANPMLKSSDGRDIPCQPLRNSSINSAMGHKGQTIS